MRNGRRGAVMILALVTITGSGCIVGQPPGKGRCLHLREATTGAAYWLYLPEGYNDPTPPGQPRKMRPLVMTFHGMKPFDDDHRQIREWQQEADRYGFVVCAPHLKVCDLFGPLPLANPQHPSLKRDEKAIIAIMDELYRKVDVDPNHVLATSWSYGGYVAHYMANRHPERFSCIAVKQSNFNEKILDPANVPRYRDHKVAIYFTENDFPICKRESRKAAEWYAHQGFDLTYAVFEKKGHERTPGVAAEFFARTCGAEAKTPPVELALMQVKEIRLPRASRSAAAKPPPSRTRTAPSIPPISNARTGAAPRPDRAPRKVAASSRTSPKSHWPPTLDATPATGRDVTRQARTILPPTANDGRDGAKNRRPSYNPVYIKLSSTIGVAPLLVSFSAAMPKALQRKTTVLWTVNKEPISSGLNGQKFFTAPGEYELSLLVTTKDGTEYLTSRTITVIDRVVKSKKK